jgi:hypothetical protein
MHRAPAFRFPLGRSHFQGILLTFTGLAGLLVGLLWYRATAQSGWRQYLFALLLLAAFANAWRSWHRTPAGSLCWDGQDWRLGNADAPACGPLAVQLDLQFCLLLSLRPNGGKRTWLCAERQCDAMQWNALRRAVFSRSIAAPGQSASANSDGNSG